MSRLHFNSPSGTADLHGSEFAWFRHIALSPASAAWDLDGLGGRLERAQEILAMMSADTLDGYLHDDLRKALDADRYGGDVFDAINRLVMSLRTALRASGLTFEVAGVRLRSTDVELNTALAAGSDPVRLAAKLNGWAESHAWVEGPDRAWLAKIIDDGLEAGIFRRGFWYAATADGLKDRWSNQGWDEVTAFLRARDDEPVVLSYSVGDSWPNPEVADWAPEVPADWRPDWATDGAGRAEWDAYSDDERASWRNDYALDAWAGLPDTEQWERALAGLRRHRPWARLSPATLAEVYFGIPVTVYDLLASDRDERVRAAAGLVDA
jgi:hypothetical protein